MTRTATQGLALVGVFVLLLVVLAVAVITPDREGLRGTVVGAGLGLFNLAAGYFVTRWALQRGMKSALTALAGGFLARLLVLAGVMILFQRTGVADPGAFALTFLVFFFVYLGVEVLLVERSMDGGRSAA